jgi:carboxyl-terminal processing protease
MVFKRSFIFTLLAIFCLSFAFFSGFFIHAHYSSSAEFPILMQAYRILKNHGLEDIPEPPTIEYGMIRGMLEAFGDPHSTFLEPVQQLRQADTLQGSFAGIGVELRKESSGEFRLLPLPEGPAAMAGIQDGDQLVRVGQLEINPETSLEAVEAALRGPEGQTITLEVLRPPDQVRLVIEVRRESILLPSTTWYTAHEDAHIGVIQINLVASSTTDEILAGVDQLRSQGISRFILDLRSNGGGLLVSAVEITRLFLREGTILQQQYRGRDIETYTVEQPGPLADIPIAVLVNEGTASAAEIIAGSLQAHGRAPLIGTPTYGKNTIQLVFDLQDGSSLHVTSAHWWIPGHIFPQEGTGLVPDILVETKSSGKDSALEAAIQYFLLPK